MQILFIMYWTGIISGIIISFTDFATTVITKYNIKFKTFEENYQICTKYEEHLYSVKI